MTAYIVFSIYFLSPQPLGTGYIAVMLPGLKHFKQEIAQLKTHAEYKRALEKRSTSMNENNEEKDAKPP